MGNRTAGRVLAVVRVSREAFDASLLEHDESWPADMGQVCVFADGLRTDAESIVLVVGAFVVAYGHVCPPSVRITIDSAHEDRPLAPSSTCLYRLQFVHCPLDAVASASGVALRVGGLVYGDDVAHVLRVLSVRADEQAARSAAFRDYKLQLGHIQRGIDGLRRQLELVGSGPLPDWALPLRDELDDLLREERRLRTDWYSRPSPYDQQHNSSMPYSFS